MLTVIGFREGVGPLGVIWCFRLTFPEKLFWLVIVIVAAVEEPCMMLSVAVLVVMLKSDAITWTQNVML